MAEPTAVPNKKLGRIVAAVFLIVCGVGAVLALVPEVGDRIAVARAGYQQVGDLARTLGPRLGSWVGFALMVIGGVTLSRWRRLPERSEYKALIVGAAIILLAAGGLATFDATTSGSPGVAIASVRTVGKTKAKKPSSTRKRTVKHKATPAPKHASTGPTTKSTPGTGGPATTPAPSTASPTPTTTTSTPVATPAPAPTPAPGDVSQTNTGAPNNNVNVTHNNTQSATTGNATGPNATSGPATNSSSNTETFTFG